MSVDEMADFLDYVYLDGYYDKEHNAVYGTMYEIGRASCRERV